MPDYQRVEFAYRRSPDQDRPEPCHHRVIIAGAGPVGLTLAIDLARHGAPVLLLDDDNRLSTGSRAICFAKRTLEIFSRLGCCERMIEKGISWQVGKVFFQGDLVYAFNLLPERGHGCPAFINLQQYYVEGFLVERAGDFDNLEIRWSNEIVGVRPAPDHVALDIRTPEGDYRLTCDYLVAADGAKSPVRTMLGLESRGRTFRDRFLIADVKMRAEFPTERWFWFDPPFHPGGSVLLHRQADDVWRIDFQLDPDADGRVETRPERVIPRIRTLLGKDIEFDLEWCSVYSFSCARLDKFRHGRVLFAGDAAHRVSPFGARGANGGIQDADNLAWKLKFVLDGIARESLLDSYASEREFAADIDILNATRSTDFITPKTETSRGFRDAVLALAKDCAFSRALVNSGRLSTPAILTRSPLNSPDIDEFKGAMRPGAPAADAPVAIDGRRDWFLNQVGDRFTAVYFADPSANAVPELQSCGTQGLSVAPVIVVPGEGTTSADHRNAIVDVEGLLAERFDARPGTLYALRPDQHICARWRHADAARLRAALLRASCAV